MHNVKPKVKTIVKETNVKTYCLKLNRSVGVFVLGEEITTHLSFPHECYHCTNGDSEMTNYDLYFFPELGMDVYVDEQNPTIIDTIMCRKYCYWQGKNLIGMLYADFLQFTNFIPIESEGEINYVYSIEHKYKQRCYIFETEGLQVWTWRKRIVSVTVSRYILDDVPK